MRTSVLATGLAGTGIGFAAAGWPAVVALALLLIVVGIFGHWVLANGARTTRLTRIITALRSSDARSSRNRRRDMAATQREVPEAESHI